tara:strand:- start:23846 stop:24244 length:399 start_codon:yes stop_codon:yes gene_type:complete
VKVETMIHPTGFDWEPLEPFPAGRMHKLAKRFQLTCRAFSVVMQKPYEELEGVLTSPYMTVDYIQRQGWRYTKAPSNSVFTAASLPSLCVAEIYRRSVAIKAGKVFDTIDSRGTGKRELLGWWEPLNPALWL